MKRVINGVLLVAAVGALSLSNAFALDPRVDSSRPRSLMQLQGNTPGRLGANSRANISGDRAQANGRSDPQPGAAGYDKLRDDQRAQLLWRER